MTELTLEQVKKAGRFAWQVNGLLYIPGHPSDVVVEADFAEGGKLADLGGGGLPEEEIAWLLSQDDFKYTYLWAVRPRASAQSFCVDEDECFDDDEAAVVRVNGRLAVSITLVPEEDCYDDDMPGWHHLPGCDCEFCK